MLYIYYTKKKQNYIIYSTNIYVIYHNNTDQTIGENGISCTKYDFSFI